MRIETAVREDLCDILKLQKTAYRSEAALLHNDAIPPLTQTLEALWREYETHIFLKEVDHGVIVGSVRADRRGRTVRIGKLMVAPEYQRRGLGSALLVQMESMFPGSRFELFTSALSAANLRLYQRAGYLEYQRLPSGQGFDLVYLQKNGTGEVSTCRMVMSGVGSSNE